ncbi:type VI secretion system protein ImpG/VasA [Chitinispirillum alkaliphilum]|nr:type VI secretion system protein ImpG/VasA [Chitinispirillum alkaliphilum]
MIEKYYEEELRYLYQSGCEFAKAHPDRAPYLNIDSVGDRDPYVERLFEGFAFLAARIREKLDDSFPQLTEGLVNLLWPQFLQEIPSLTMMQFTPRKGFLQESRVLPARSEIVSGSVGEDGVVCKFTTTNSLVMNPISLRSVQRHTDKMNNETISFTFNLDSDVEWLNYDLKKIRLFLHAEFPVALMVHRALTTMVKHAEIKMGAEGEVFQINPKNAITPGGMDASEAVLPQMRRSFAGFNILREYFVYPEKFLFIDLNGIDSIPAPETTPDIITFTFTIKEPFPHDKQIRPDMFKLNCCPATNMFTKNVEPIIKTGKKSDYRVIADSSYSTSVRVHSLISVLGIDRVTGEKFTYEPMYTFRNIGNRRGKTYAFRSVQTPAGTREVDIMLSGSQLDNKQIREESLVIEAWCTNGNVPRDHIREGDINCPGRGFPDFVSASNITRPTLPFFPPSNHDLLWRFQAHMAATQISLASKDVLKKFLELYNWSAQEGRTRRIESITDVESEPVDAVYKGGVIRGVKFKITLEEQAFIDSGDLHLFGLVISRFLSQYVSINSFCKVEFILKPSGKIVKFNNVEGERCLI